MKHTLAWISAESATLLLTLGAVAMAIAALLNLLGIPSIFSTWFKTFYVPGLLAVGLFVLRFLAQLAAIHYLDEPHDQDEPLGFE